MNGSGTPEALASLTRRGGRLAPVAALASLRFGDILVLQGPPIMGLALTWHPASSPGAGSLTLFLLANWLLVAHVFCLNDWAGIAADQGDTNKSGRTFLARGATRFEMGLLTLGLGALSLCLFGLLPRPAVLTAAAIVLLSFLYSHPAVGGKAIPGVSSLLHVVGGGLHFLLGYGLVRPPSASAVFLGLYVGLVFAAGHLSQEIADREGDGEAGLRTTAVRLGATRAFVASFLLFTASYGLIVGLALLGAIPTALAGLVALYPVHALIFWRALRDGLTFPVVNRYRRRYRVLHALIGLAIVVAMVRRAWL